MDVVLKGAQSPVQYHFTIFILIIVIPSQKWGGI